MKNKEEIKKIIFKNNEMLNKENELNEKNNLKNKEKLTEKNIE